MRRRLFTFASAVSLVLCAATGVLWVRSQSACELVSLNGEDFSVFVGHGGGALMFGRSLNSDGGEPDRPRVEHIDMPGLVDVGLIARGGKVWVSEGRLALYSEGIPPELRDDRRGEFSQFAGSVPLWTAGLVTMALPTASASRFVRRRLLRPQPPGLCLTCGYDLRATPGRCPECGTVPTNSADSV